MGNLLFSININISPVLFVLISGIYKHVKAKALPQRHYRKGIIDISGEGDVNPCSEESEGLSFPFLALDLVEMVTCELMSYMPM